MSETPAKKPWRVLTPAQRERRKEIARRRYAENEQIRARYQNKAREAIKERNEKRKVVRREQAKAQGRTIRCTTEEARINTLIMDEYNREQGRVRAIDSMWLKHIERRRHGGAMSARAQWAARKHEPGYKQRKALKTRLWKFVTTKKKTSISQLIGCSKQAFIEHIARLFTKGMTWKNYGEWEMDHIIPCTAFDLTKAEDQAKCFHYTNIQPMWKVENIRKGNKIGTVQPELLLHVA